MLQIEQPGPFTANRRIRALLNDTVDTVTESLEASLSASGSTTARCFPLSVVAIRLPNRQNRVDGGPLRAPFEALPAAPLRNDSSEKARFRVDMSKSKLEMVCHIPTDSRQQ